MDMTITFPGGKKVDADYNGFRIATDQSVRGGGDGSAPEPFSLFLASIGTCAGIYVLGFCQQRGIDTTGLTIIQSMNFNPTTRLIDQINLDIKLPESFPEKYKSAVINSAKLCAVKRHLENPPEFVITAV
ncbi:MAG: OsmC family protein [Candidatus Neomarinimicrobiota bacterium]